jgi:hypothetical protein
MYELRSEQPISRVRFYRRFSLHVLVAAGMLVVSLLIGMWGYMVFENLAWRDAFLNSAMLLGGMGPVDAPKSNGGKLFAGCYALYAGLLFVVTVGVMLAPVLHRMLHKFYTKR